MEKEKNITYADFGVDGALRNKSKKALELLTGTYGLSRKGEVIMLPYGKALKIGGGQVLILEIEGVGTNTQLTKFVL